MRANGVEEVYITGDADPYEKFEKWVETMPYCLRNPLYVWSHLELQRYFEIDLTIEPKNAKEIWETANAVLPSLSAHQVLRQFDVAFVGTTDDPADTLEHHERLREQGLKTVVAPTYRPDAGFAVHDGEKWRQWVSRLGAQAKVAIQSFDDLVAALKIRHDDFAALQGAASDHGFGQTPQQTIESGHIQRVVQSTLKSGDAALWDTSHLTLALLREIGRWNTEKDWAMQFHIGPFRNNNTLAFEELGPDTGFDSIGDYQHGEAIAIVFLDGLAKSDALPKTILYNNNPVDNYLFATMVGNFQDASRPGKMQFGAGWWHLDQKEGIEWQLNALSNTGLLRRFVGMITDSRSFLSYPRHEYFRRVLCNLLGNEMEKGELPDDFELIGKLVEEVCFTNARDYFGAELHPDYRD